MSPGSRPRATSPPGTAPLRSTPPPATTHATASPAADRHINHVLHLMAVVQLRTRTTEGRAYYDRKTAAGNRPNEAMRCLKRRLSDIVYRTMLDDVVTTSGTGPGGHRGASLISSAAGSQPHTDTSDQSLPGPVTHHDRSPIKTPA